ncbi:DUF4406 domain-containing protein [Zobellella sp. DQSA1]
MQKLKIYIAGPMSGITNDNRDAFHRQAELLAAAAQYPGRQRTAARL